MAQITSLSAQHCTDPNLASIKKLVEDCLIKESLSTIVGTPLTRRSHHGQRLRFGGGVAGASSYRSSTAMCGGPETGSEQQHLAAEQKDARVDAHKQQLARHALFPRRQWDAQQSQSPRPGNDFRRRFLVQQSELSGQGQSATADPTRNVWMQLTSELLDGCPH